MKYTTSKLGEGKMERKISQERRNKKEHERKTNKKHKQYGGNKSKYTGKMN